MTTLTKEMKQLKERNEKAFVPYIMAGDGPLEQLEETIVRLQNLGATAIELGIPYSDPVADGVVIREAGERALAAGVTLDKILETVATFTRVRIPLLTMAYVNTIFAYGIERFAKRAQQVGIRGAIIPDLPYEERALVAEPFQQHDIALIPLVALTSPKERIEKLVQEAEGFIYAVTINGVTGNQNQLNDSPLDHFDTLRAMTDLPVYAGFGITTAEDVECMNAHTDGVIVGSAIVRALHEQDREALEQLFVAYA